MIDIVIRMGEMRSSLEMVIVECCMKITQGLVKV